MEQLTIGQRILLKRKELKLSQAEVGRIIGCSWVTISHWENGKTSLRRYHSKIESFLSLNPGEAKQILGKR
jgi:transcriptional regulator with XRE-family HTH domain